MSYKSCNQIRRLTINTLAADQDSALQRRTEISRALPIIHSALDETLEQISARLKSEIWIRIDKLHLNISLNSPSFSEQQAVQEQIAGQLLSALEYRLLTDDSLTTEVSSGTETSFAKKQPREKSASEPYLAEEIDYRTTSAEDVIFEALVHYLHHGNLPWYAVTEALSVSDIDQEWQQIITNGDTLETIRNRLLHFDAHIRLWGLLTACDITDIPFESMADKAIHASSLKAFWQLSQSQKILSRMQSLTILAAISSDTPVTPFMHDISPVSDLQIEQLKRQLASDETLLGHTPELTAKLLGQAPKLSGHTPKQSKELSGQTPEKTEYNNGSDAITEQTYRVQFGGLILLYPYLPRLFKRLNWLTEENQIKSEFTGLAAKALVYLATGSQQVAEYQMSWIKVLLGQQPDTLLIPDDTPLEAGVTNELDMVLSSLLSHWAAVKSSSVMAIQGTFIAREGLLRKQDDYWQLTIEPKGMDVLIKQLPFPLETVSLLWIKQPIRVSW